MERFGGVVRTEVGAPTRPPGGNRGGPRLEATEVSQLSWAEVLQAKARHAQLPTLKQSSRRQGGGVFSRPSLLQLLQMLGRIAWQFDPRDHFSPHHSTKTLHNGPRSAGYPPRRAPKRLTNGFFRKKNSLRDFFFPKNPFVSLLGARLGG